MFLTKDQVKNIIQSAPAGTSAGGIVAGLRERGYSMEGYDDTLKNTLVKKEPNLMDSFSEGFNEIYKNYSQAPLMKQASAGLGYLVKTPAKFLGTTIAAAAENVLQTYNLLTGKDYDYMEQFKTGSSIKIGEETGEAGFEMGKQALPLATLGVFGKGVQTAFGVSMMYEGGKNYLEGIKAINSSTTDAERNTGLEQAFNGIIQAIPGAFSMVHATGAAFGEVKVGAIKGKMKAEFLEKGKMGTAVEQAKGVVGELKKDLLFSKEAKQELGSTYRYLKYGETPPIVSSSSKSQFTSAIKPEKSKRAAFQNDLDIVLSDLAQENVGELGIIDIQKYVQKKKAEIWKDNMDLVEKGNEQGQTIDGDLIAKRIRELKDDPVLQTENIRYERNALTGEMERIEFGELAKLEQTAKAYEGKTIDFLTGESILEIKNAGLNAYYKKNPFLRALSQKTDKELMTDKAIAESIREQQDKLIQNKDIKRRWGAYRNVSEQVNNRILSLENLDVNSLAEKIGVGRQAAQVIFGVATGNPATVLSGVADKLLTSYMKKLNASDFKIRQATKELSDYYKQSKKTSAIERAVDFIKNLADKKTNITSSNLNNQLKASSLSDASRQLLLESIKGQQEINIPEFYLDLQRDIAKSYKQKLLTGSETIEQPSVEQAAIKRSQEMIKEIPFKPKESRKISRKTLPKVSEEEIIASKKAAGIFEPTSLQKKDPFSGKIKTIFSYKDMKIKNEGIENIKHTGLGTLEEIIDHETLKKFPSFKDVNIVLTDKMEGFFNKSTNTMTLPKKLLGQNETTKTMLVHEIEHILQYEEGLPTGGNPSMFISEAKYQRIGLEMMQKDLWEIVLSGKKIKGDTIAMKNLTNLIKQIEETGSPISKDIIEKIITPKNANILYKRMAGEMAARKMAELKNLPLEEVLRKYKFSEKQLERAIIVIDKATSLMDIKGFHIPRQKTFKKSSLANKIRNKIKIGMTVEDVTSRLDVNTAGIIRGTKGMSAKDIMAKYPDIQLKRDVPATDVYGNKVVIEKGEALTPYELKGNKVLLQDGETYIVSKNQFQNIKGNAVSSEVKEFAPELEGLEQTVKKEMSYGSLADKERRNSMQSIESAYQRGDITKIKRDRIIKNLESEPTKFSQYQLPNGKNYQEILIRAKPEIRGLPKELKTVFDDIGDYKNAPEFRSSHWQEPNVISHLRLNERTYKGQKVTFMEEAQSDWAREGRTKGFATDAKDYEAIKDNWGNWDVYDKNGNMVGNVSTARNINTAEEAINTVIKKDSVPQNPLLKNWQELSVKRGLQEAVANDSEYFAWINGEQTSARYNLATQVDNVRWKKIPEDMGISSEKMPKQVVITPKSGDNIVIGIDDNGKIMGGKQDWRGKKLDEVLGKGLADQIMSKESGTLSGEGLKFGGEWATNLYDKQIKNIVEDVTGGKVEVLDMGLPIESGAKNVWGIVGKDGSISYVSGGKDVLTPNKLKVGLEIAKKEGITDSNKYIITDILEKGKFKAVPKTMHGTQWHDQNERTFDISRKTTTQQGIKLTPEIKAKIRGEALKLKKNIPLPKGKGKSERIFNLVH